MNIQNFDDLLSAARAQPIPQRLLFVFVGAELPEGSTQEQRLNFEAGQGGALVPLMCVDKSPQELDSFETLVQEAREFGQPWVLVFAAAMGGSVQKPPTSADADQPLQAMVEAVKRGDVGLYVPFDADGMAVQIG
jgi:hypothetical protein